LSTALYEIILRYCPFSAVNVDGFYATDRCYIIKPAYDGRRRPVTAGMVNHDLIKTIACGCEVISQPQAICLLLLEVECIV